MKRLGKAAILLSILTVVACVGLGCGGDLEVQGKPTDSRQVVIDIEETETEYASASTVYVTPSGTRYHYSESCAGTNASAVALEDIKYTKAPCGTCAKADIGRWETASETTSETEFETKLDVESETESETEAETETKSETESEAETEPEVPSASEGTVYVTPTGTKYHYLENCAGKNAIAVELDQARQTQAPCGTCAKEDLGTETETESESVDETEASTPTGRTVYVTPTGKKYHYSRSCAGKNAIPKSLEDARRITEGACKKCG